MYERAKRNILCSFTFLTTEIWRYFVTAISLKGVASQQLIVRAKALNLGRLNTCQIVVYPPNALQ
jgi:hypothetical protein